MKLIKPPECHVGNWKVAGGQY